MLYVYDCSNSPERPKHRGSGGPVQNGMITCLKQNAKDYNVEFVAMPEHADVILTNDVFPKEILALDKPRVKRMDGVFWQQECQDRNAAYVQAAQQASWVIFISRYSYQCYLKAYGSEDKCRPHGVKNWTIIRSAADPHVFRPFQRHSRGRKPRTFVACATSWERPEKRLQAVLNFAEDTGVEVRLAGQVADTFADMVPKNARVQLSGCRHSLWNSRNNRVVWDPTMVREILASADAFVNFSYRDAGPKVVAEAVACGLPVLYADSGGTSEMVHAGDIMNVENGTLTASGRRTYLDRTAVDGGTGVGLPDPEKDDNTVPMLDREQAVSAYCYMCDNWHWLTDLADKFDSKQMFDQCLREYFYVLEKAAAG